MASLAPTSKPTDRQTTTPFLLKLFYRTGSFHRLDDFTPTSVPQAHFQIYTWPDLSLRELALLLTSTLSALPNSPTPPPAAGTRLAFRLTFPDTRGASTSNGAPGRFIARDLGSVVVGEGADSAPGAAGHDAGRTLQDARFIIGDYVSCCILPPLANGDVAPPPVSAGPGILAPAGNGYGPRGGRRGGYGDGGGYGRLNDQNGGFRDDRGYGGGYGGRRGGGGGGFRGDFGGGRGGPAGVALPQGEWRRGERLPEGPAGGPSGFGGGRDGGGGGYRGGRGGRGRPW